MGYEVQIGWGKSVPLPPTPFYMTPAIHEEKKATLPDPPSGDSKLPCVFTFYFIHYRPTL